MKNIDWSPVIWWLLQTLIPLAVASLIVLSGKASQLIHAKVKSTYLAGVLTRLNDLVLTIVQSLNQTWVADTKTANGGKLTAIQKAQVKSDAVGQLKAQLGETGLNELMDVLGANSGQIESLLSHKIEAAVGLAAQSSTQAPSPVAAGTPAAVGPLKASSLPFGGPTSFGGAPAK